MRPEPFARALIATPGSALAACALTTDHGGPGKAARPFFAARDEGDYELVEILASEDPESRLERGVDAISGVVGGYCDSHTRGRELEEVEERRAGVTPKEDGESGEGETAGIPGNWPERTRVGSSTRAASRQDTDGTAGRRADERQEHEEGNLRIHHTR